MLPAARLTGDPIAESWSQALGRQGGDFVEHTRLARGWRIALGDVSGHGDAAALAAGLARARIAADLAERVDQHVFRTWNRDLQSLLEDQFVCLTILEFDASTGRLTIANAGNPAVLIRRGDGRVDSFAGTGPVLGVLSDQEWRPPQFVQTTLSGADQVVCFTDGLTEQINTRQELFGLERVIQLVSRFCPSPVRMLRRSMRAFARSVGLRDDLTVLALQTTSLAA